MVIGCAVVSADPFRECGGIVATHEAGSCCKQLFPWLSSNLFWVQQEKLVVWPVGVHYGEGADWDLYFALYYMLHACRCLSDDLSRIF